ncbi:AIF_HP2_G0052370.mRNA.1.CDS.1 [Saccharomyces cerevisiae]|nr:AIF_HP2_G0052370.mRNA.1.CDS.1 [Saccharomyces cerevisiae]CAI6798093.1 AIF_HP2_G0052370.mRNA.1.CDS.1 [Saccharomyces cerevisiae]
MSEPVAAALPFYTKSYIHSHTPSVYYNICIINPNITPCGPKVPGFLFFSHFFFSKSCCQALIDSFSSTTTSSKMLEKK